MIVVLGTLANCMEFERYGLDRISLGIPEGHNEVKKLYPFGKGVKSDFLGFCGLL